MSVKPRLFNTEMVRAILEGKKTVTRRLVKPQPDNKHQSPLGYCTDSTGSNKDIGKYGWGIDEYGGHIQSAKPPCRIGDILYVRETWQEVFETEIVDLDEFNMETKNIRECIKNFDEIQKTCTGLSDRWSRPIDKPRNRYIVYKADGLEYTDKKYELRWRPSLHMPKEAARIFLKVTDIRVERLNDMNIHDMINEGINTDGIITTDGPIGYRVINRFEELWNSTIKKSDFDIYSFGADPWVWVIDFERVNKEDVEQLN